MGIVPIFLGPLFYKHRQHTNQRIQLLRWRWLSIRETIDAYAQLFSLVVWYARKQIFERQFKADLEKARRFVVSTNTKVDSIFYVEDQHVFIAMSVEGIQRAESGPEHQTKLAAMRYNQEKIDDLSLYFSTFNDSDIVETLTPRALLDYAVRLQTRFPQTTLQRLYSYAGKIQPQPLSSSKLQILKSLLLESFEHFYETIGIPEHLGNLALHSFKRAITDDPEAAPTETSARTTTVSTLTPDVLALISSQVTAHAFKNSKKRQEIIAELDRIFMQQTSLIEILHELHGLWTEATSAAREIIEEYRSLVNKDHLKQINLECTEDFKRFIAGSRLQDLEARGVFDVAAILKSKIGSLTLPLIKWEDADQFLEKAIIAYNRSGTKSHREQLERLAIVAHLIQRGYSLFSGPIQETVRRRLDTPPTADVAITSEAFPWSILISVLEMMVCITPFSELVRQDLLDYSRTAVDIPKAF